MDRKHFICFQSDNAIFESLLRIGEGALRNTKTFLTFRNPTQKVSVSH